MTPAVTTSQADPAHASTPEGAAPAASAPAAGRLPNRFWSRTFAAAPAAVALTLLTRILAGAAVPIAPDFAPLQLAPVGALTAIALHLAAVVLAACYRFTARPVHTYQRVAAAVLLASVVPDFALLVRGAPGATPAAVGLLVLLHVVAGSVGVWVLPALAHGRGRPEARALPGAAPFKGGAFKDGASSFGTFYPKHYVLAVYPDDASAGRAAAALRAAGFAGDDVLDAPGAAVVAYEDAADARKGVLSRLGQQWARLYTDATATSRRLRAAAEHGAAFVLAYAPGDGQAARAADVLRPLGPNGLHYYGTFTVTRLS